ncbi:MAG TPA: SagB/ThcOx family dehydrogenase [Jatrophihabitans sp.]|nr:SagB/ThcOx family dehydrogenase [Jatrophihabitans sp.]
MPVDDPRIVQDLEVNDWDRLPYWHKHYPEPLTTVPLPRELPTMPTPATAVLAGTAGTEQSTLELAGLARLLFLSAGVVRVGERRGRPYYFRAAGSAGARFPLEVYVAVPDGTAETALPAGVHWYDPAEHALVQVGPPPAGSAPALVVTGVPWRTGWRYRERGFRHIYWDAGTLLAQQLALAESAGLAPRLYSRFPDGELSGLVGADGVHEFPVAVLVLGAVQPELVATGPAAAGQLDGAPLEFPLVTSTQHAGDLAGWGSAWPAGEPVDTGSLDTAETLDALVLRRGSQRRMDPAGSVPLALLRDSLTVALRGIDLPHWVVVHAVDGLEPGLYRWPELDRPVRPGLLRDEAWRVCMEQGLARDAAFVVLAAVAVAGLSDREYREAQLAAGIVEGRLHLLAYAAGASATGMTFYDSELAGFLGESLDGLLFTCVGVPEYSSVAGGPPGAPAFVRQVAPR